MLYSRYRLSTSNPFGFLPSYRIGTSTTSPSSFVTFVGVSSTTRDTILGYFFESHLNRAGTPLPCQLIASVIRVTLVPSELGRRLTMIGRFPFFIYTILRARKDAGAVRAVLITDPPFRTKRRLRRYDGDAMPQSDGTSVSYMRCSEARCTSQNKSDLHLRQLLPLKKGDSLVRKAYVRHPPSCSLTACLGHLHDSTIIGAIHQLIMTTCAIRSVRDHRLPRAASAYQCHWWWDPASQDPFTSGRGGTRHSP